MKIFDLKKGLQIRITENKYELWLYFNEQVYYKLLDISESTCNGLLYDTLL